MLEEKSSRAPSEVATTVRPAICISTSLQESKPTTISHRARNQQEQSINTLRRYHVHSLRSVTFYKADGKSFNIFGSKAIPAYGYFFNDMKGIKVYRPKAENRFLYGGDLPTPYVFGWEQLQENGDMVFITGGEKDVLSLASHGYNAIAFNSETAKIPADKIKLLSRG